MSFFRPRHNGKYGVAGGRTPAARTDDLVVEEIDEELVVYDQRLHHAHALTPVAARVWRACDGHTPAGEIAAALDLDEPTVARALAELEECELLEGGLAGLTRRELTAGAAKVGAAATVGAPLIYSIVAPTAAAAQTVEICFVAIAGESRDDCFVPQVCARCLSLNGTGPGVSGHVCHLASETKSAPMLVEPPRSVLEPDDPTPPPNPPTAAGMNRVGPHTIDWHPIQPFVVTCNWFRNTLSILSVDPDTGEFTGDPKTFRGSADLRGPDQQNGTATSDTVGLFGAQFSPNGKWLAVSTHGNAGGTGGKVYMFKVASNGDLTPVIGSSDMPGGVSSGAINATHVKWDPSGKFLAVNHGEDYALGGLSIFTVNDGNGEIHLVGGAPVGPVADRVGLAWHSSGKLLATTRPDDEQVELWSVTDAGVATRLLGVSSDGAVPWDCDFGSGNLLGVANAHSNTAPHDGTNGLSIYSVGTSPASLKHLASYRTGPNPHGVAFDNSSPCGELVNTANLGANTVSIFTVDVHTGTLSLLTTTDVGDDDTLSPSVFHPGPKHAEWSPDGLFLATANYASNGESYFTGVGGTRFAVGHTASVIEVACHAATLTTCVADCRDCTTQLASFCGAPSGTRVAGCS